MRTNMITVVAMLTLAVAAPRSASAQQVDASLPDVSSADSGADAGTTCPEIDDVMGSSPDSFDWDGAGFDLGLASCPGVDAGTAASHALLAVAAAAPAGVGVQLDNTTADDLIIIFFYTDAKTGKDVVIATSPAIKAGTKRIASIDNAQIPPAAPSVKFDVTDSATKKKKYTVTAGAPKLVKDPTSGDEYNITPATAK